MGGSGSGRHNRSTRLTTEQARCLDVRDFSTALRRSRRQVLRIPWRLGGLFASVFGPSYVSLHAIVPYADGMRARYELREPYLRIRTPVTIDSTPQPFGGRRIWFHCQLCRRRCGKLYLTREQPRLWCRLCHNLAYASQREAVARRWERRARRIVDRLGGEAPDGLVYKPHAMRWRTFHRLMDEVQQWNDRAFGHRIRGLSKLHSWHSRLIYGRLS